MEVQYNTLVSNADFELIGGVPDFVGWTKPSKFKSYLFDENQVALSGPFSKGITATTSTPNGGMIGVTEDMKVVSCDMNKDMNASFDPVPSLVWWDNAFPLDVGEEGIVGSSSEFKWHYRGNFLQEPFGKPTVEEGTIKDPVYFRDAYLSMMETNWMNLGDDHNEKQVHRLDLSFLKNSFGFLWGFVQNDESQSSGQFKGLIKSEHMKVFTNIRGRRFKAKLIIASHNKYPWSLREIGVGHLVGKSF